MRTLFAVGLMVTTWSSAQAQGLELPHSFEPGTPARASEVNANFEALLEAVSANHAALGALASGQLEPIGVLLILHPDYGEPIPVVGFEWSTAFNWQGGGAGSWDFGPLMVLKPSDVHSPNLFRDLIAGQPYQDITVELTSPDGTISSYFAATARLSALETVTSGGMVLDRLTFSDYTRVQVKVTDPATNAEVFTCRNVDTHTEC